MMERGTSVYLLLLNNNKNTTRPRTTPRVPLPPLHDSTTNRFAKITPWRSARKNAAGMQGLSSKRRKLVNKCKEFETHLQSAIGPDQMSRDGRPPALCCISQALLPLRI